MNFGSRFEIGFMSQHGLTIASGHHMLPCQRYSCTSTVVPLLLFKLSLLVSIFLTS